MSGCESQGLQRPVHVPDDSPAERSSEAEGEAAAQSPGAACHANYIRQSRGHDSLGLRAPDAEPQLIVTIDSAMRKAYDTQAPMNRSKATAQVSFSAGSHDWEYREVRIMPKSLKPPKAEAADLDDPGGAKDDLDTGDDITVEKKFIEYEGTPYWVTVQVASRSERRGCPTGEDLSLGGQGSRLGRIHRRRCRTTGRNPFSSKAECLLFCFE
jgi:hypothetical protein